MSRAAVLTALLDGELPIKCLVERAGLSRAQVYRILAELKQAGLVEYGGGVARVASLELQHLLKRIRAKYDLSRLLAGRTLEILDHVQRGASASRLAELLGVSRSTIHRYLSRLCELGVVRREGDRLEVVDEDVAKLVELLRLRRMVAVVEPYAEVLYADHFIVKRVPRGREARGTPTAFTVFREYSVEVSTSWDYYVQPPMPVGLEEAIVHALLASRSRYERTLAAVVYAKNIDKVRRGRLRAAARGTPALPLVLELDDYVSGVPVEHYDSFLPWDEFRELAELYSVELRPALPAHVLEEYFREVGRALAEEVYAYVFGGFNLLVEELKPSTKDVDLLVLTEEELRSLMHALEEAGFTPLAEAEPRRATVYEKGSLRVDLFLGEVGSVVITRDMVRRAARGVAYGKLHLRMMALEDVVFLKSVSGRERDVEDVSRIVRARRLKWRVVLEDLLSQENRGKLALTLLDTLEVMEEAHSIRVSRRLKARVRELALEYLVEQALKLGHREPREIAELLGVPRSTVMRILGRLRRDRPAAGVSSGSGLQDG
ncbi:MAG: hypothetical protein DRJ96_05445 [Thermoprotei archaeon]|nr:MAG: hypothetical protein DRJ96_05445 [Thermoprotei archaeon]